MYSTALAALPDWGPENMIKLKDMAVMEDTNKKAHYNLIWATQVILKRQRARFFSNYIV